jgi:hypothetical protein
LDAECFKLSFVTVVIKSQAEAHLCYDNNPCDFERIIKLVFRLSNQGGIKTEKDGRRIIAVE